MREVLVFGGTTEGRELASWLARRGRCHVTYLAATDLGRSMASNDPRVEALAGPLDEAGMRALLGSRDVAVVVDATHPYATRITAGLARVTADLGVGVIRVRRASVGLPGEARVMVDAYACARALDASEGPILLTTGTHDLDAFCEAITDYQSRIFARILPTVSSLERAQAAGLDPSHIVCIQGPTSVEMNLATIHEFGIRHLVTKESGAVGGFPEKVEAARRARIELWVIRRPADAGVSLQEARRLLEVRHGC